MDRVQTKVDADICHRCLQSVPPKATRCPRCGEPLHKSSHVRVVLGVLGLVLFLAIALVAFRLMHSAGKRPVSDDGQQTTGEQSHAPSPADKQPALGQ